PALMQASNNSLNAFWRALVSSGTSWAVAEPASKVSARTGPSSHSFRIVHLPHLPPGCTTSTALLDFSATESRKGESTPQSGMCLAAGLRWRLAHPRVGLLQIDAAPATGPTLDLPWIVVHRQLRLAQRSDGRQFLFPEEAVEEDHEGAGGVVIHLPQAGYHIL